MRRQIAAFVDRYRDDGIRGALSETALYGIDRFVAHPVSDRLVSNRRQQQLSMCLRVGYWPRIESPRTLNEKIMHRKLYTDDERFVRVEDKWTARAYVRNHWNAEILPEVYHVTETPSTIPFDALPDEYVVKPSHLMGKVIFVDEDESPDESTIESRCRDWLDRTHGVSKGEYWYDEIDPRILIEERLRAEDGSTPIDYKFFVFHGTVEYVQTNLDRFDDHTKRFYDRDWNPCPFAHNRDLGPVIDRPERLETMIEIAERLGRPFEFIRVDLYQPSPDRVVFGELTVAPASGGGAFDPQEYDFVLGEQW